MPIVLRLVSIIAITTLLFASPVVAQNGTDGVSQALPKDANNLTIETDKGNYPFTIELALDDNARAKGLMFRTKMAENHGMLFDFAETRPIYMWMKNTYISLDMIFLNEDGSVHHLVEGTTPLSQSLIGSGGPVRFVLEVKAGTVQRIGLEKGHKLRHILFTPNLQK